MQHEKPVLSISQTIYTVALLLFFFILLNGYVLNLVGGHRADAGLVLIGVIVEFGATFLLARRRIKIEFDALELVGFLGVVVGVWVYFVSPAFPTLLPPTLSSDAVRVYLQVIFSHSEGRLVSWYPAGNAFLIATLARWLGADPLRVLHPLAALVLALSAGAVYGMARELLRGRPSDAPPLAASIFVSPARGNNRDWNAAVHSVCALLAPAALFMPWSYFAGILLWEQYFAAQSLAQFFLLAGLWFAARYAEQPAWIFAAAFGAALLGIVAAYPYFVPLALAMFAFATSLSPFARKGWRSVGSPTFAALTMFLALVLIAALALQQGGILEILGAGRIATMSDVGEGGVTNPSIENLGGPVLLLLALVGIPFAWRAGALGRALLALGLAWLLQLTGLLAIRPLFQISEYRLDKTFYALVFPLALVAALGIARLLTRAGARLKFAPRRRVAGLILSALLLGAAVAAQRPPPSFTPLSEAEIQTARWAKENILDTYQISYLDPLPIRAYWLIYGIWRERVPNEWFVWIPAGTKMGPARIEDWLTDPAWPPYLLVRDTAAVPASFAAQTRVVYQYENAAILQKAAPPRVDYAPQFLTPWHFMHTLRLLGYDVARTTIHAGETLTFTTYTQTGLPPPATVYWRAELLNRNGGVVAKAEREPFGGKYPLQRWQPNQIARDEWRLTLAPDATPGAYELRLGLYRRDNGAPIDVWHTSEKEAVHKWMFPAAVVTRVKIPVAPPSAEELARAQALEARVGDAFALARYALEYDRAARRVRLTLYWQCLKPTQAAFTVFTQLLDASGKIIAQKDAPPRDGDYPTFIWDTGEIVREQSTLDWPGDAAPASIVVGMYASSDLQRLPVFDARGKSIGDAVVIRDFAF